MGRTVFIGDVHGCYQEMIALLKKINYVKTKDRLIFVGDLVHKGPESAQVLEFVYHNSYELVLGNHDYFFLKALEGEVDPYPEYEQILSKLSVSISDIKNWLKGIPCFIEDKEFLVVHAGLDPVGDCIKNKDFNICMNIRFWNENSSKYSSITEHKRVNDDGLIAWYESESDYFCRFKQIIYGHSAKKEVQFSKNHRIIGIDTGCCYGGHLTAYILEEKKIVQVKSLQKKQFDY